MSKRKRIEMSFIEFQASFVSRGDTPWPSRLDMGRQHL
jgi:hypothetical protein